MDLEELFFDRVSKLNEEHDCGAHTVGLQVRYVPNPTSDRPKVVAGLLRVLALHADGYCAVRGTKSVQFHHPGMTFRFSDTAHRDKFVALCNAYLPEPIVKDLSFTHI